MRIILNIYLIAILAIVVGCSRGQLKTGTFFVFFEDIEDVNKFVVGDEITIEHNDSSVTLTPKRLWGNDIIFSIDVECEENWSLKSEGEFRELVKRNLSPSPDEIHGIAFSSLEYTERTFSRRESIEELWNYLKKRELATYSIDEIRQLVPKQYESEFPLLEPAQIQKLYNKSKNDDIMDVAINWPGEGRLVFTFFYRPFQKVLMTSKWKLKKTGKDDVEQSNAGPDGP